MLRARCCEYRLLTVLGCSSLRQVTCVLPFAQASRVNSLLGVVKCYKSHNGSPCLPGATLLPGSTQPLCMWSLIEEFVTRDLGPASIFTGYVILSVRTSFLFGNHKRDVVTLAPNTWKGYGETQIERTACEKVSECHTYDRNSWASKYLHHLKKRPETGQQPHGASHTQSCNQGRHQLL